MAISGTRRDRILPFPQERNHVFDKNGNPRIFLVDNKHGEQFFVTASMREDGRIWYMYSLTAKDEELIGIKGWSYSASRCLARAVLRL
jgi:hypothetical protein